MRVIAFPEYCLGCGLCRVFCAASHDGYEGSVIKAFKKGQPAPRAALLFSSGNSWLNTCMHCNEAPCVNACITGAMSIDEQGTVFIRDDRCVQCYTCVMVCPYGHIQPNPDQARILKCDLCRENNNIPACVANCPNGALQLEGGESHEIPHHR